MSESTPETPSEARPRTPSEFLQGEVRPRYQALRAEAKTRLAQAQKEWDDLCAASASLCWQVEGEPPVYLNFTDGEVAVAAEPAHEPVMSVRMSAADWLRFATGQVAGGFVDGGNRGGFGGSRVERLRPLRGTVRFTLTDVAGGGDWSVDVGLNAPPAEPTATISMPAEVAAEIQGGKLNPQMAFMQGKVKMAGDAGLVMQFGMAMFA